MGDTVDVYTGGHHTESVFPSSTISQNKGSTETLEEELSWDHPPVNEMD